MSRRRGHRRRCRRDCGDVGACAPGRGHGPVRGPRSAGRRGERNQLRDPPHRLRLDPRRAGDAADPALGRAPRRGRGNARDPRLALRGAARRSRHRGRVDHRPGPLHAGARRRRAGARRRDPHRRPRHRAARHADGQLRRPVRRRGRPPVRRRLVRDLPPQGRVLRLRRHRARPDPAPDRPPAARRECWCSRPSTARSSPARRRSTRPTRRTGRCGPRRSPRCAPRRPSCCPRSPTQSRSRAGPACAPPVVASTT